ncbi:hypothetical protein OAO87_04565 [bacterium]|nr:hypothetical protein [bacterium]
MHMRAWCPGRGPLAECRPNVPHHNDRWVRWTHAYKRASSHHAHGHALPTRSNPM